MSFQLTCVSHGPALKHTFPVPANQDEVVAAYEARGKALRAFDPELIVMFAPDHYAGIQLDLVPPFCLGIECEAVADFGGWPGDLDVPAALAWELAAWLRYHDIDIAVSHHLIVDHGFSQPLHRLTGAVGRYPVLPIMINAACRPASPMRRIRLLGEAVGRFAAATGKRVAFLASGGLSHHPANIYPQKLEDALPEVREYMMWGGRRGEMKLEGWLSFLEERTLIGGQRVARGEMTATDVRLNPNWDKEFLRRFQAADFTTFEGWSPAEMIEQAGVGSIEVQNWIAAGAAAGVAGVGPVVIDYYAPVVEYRIAVGVAHADPL